MDSLLTSSSNYLIIVFVFMTTFYSTVNSSIVYQNHQQLQLNQYQQRQLQRQHQQQSTNNYYSNQYVTGNSNHGYTSHLVARKGGITYQRQTGSGRSSNYGLQDNLNGYVYGQPQAQIPVLMVPIVPDFGLIYQSPESPPSYHDNPLIEGQRIVSNNQPIGSSAPRYSSYYNVELVNMLYGRPQSTIIDQQNDSQFVISRK